ncbi:hypothetical protein [Methanothrix sp.]|uniref:hypothetical protein n=1 Tax=Methanothrix sp. TaxID=90426 RepID=UPI00345EC829
MDLILWLALNLSLCSNLHPSHLHPSYLHPSYLHPSYLHPSYLRYLALSEGLIYL